MAEVAEAGARFGPQDRLTDAEWLAVLAEEVGEAAKEVTHLIEPRFRSRVHPRLVQAALAEEITQVAAVAVRWLAALGRRP
ncbi:MAG: hypothetical protein H0W37_11615 [Pseudonocardiales bacterium]|nr:hypothetical protein [Pseudonocardiales bacterium]